jgi:tRNA threonylcarbamoyladenosine biosynthesis protein TsaE
VNPTLRLHGLEQTAELGRRLGEALRPGDIVLLEGALGSGKTTLVQALARGLGSTDEVASPTFVLVRHYRGRLPVVHADLYRLDSDAEVADLGLLELSQEGVLVVEWADRARSLDALDALRLRLAAGDGDDERVVEVIAAPPHLAGLPGMEES